MQAYSGRSSSGITSPSDVTEDPQPNPAELQPAGCDDDPQASTWNAGVRDADTDSDVTDESSESIDIDSAVPHLPPSGSSMNPAVTTAADQMTGGRSDWLSRLPHIRQRGQACLDTVKNIPYKFTGLCTLTTIATIGLTTYSVHSIGKSSALSDSDRFSVQANTALVSLTQLSAFLAGIVTYQLYQNRR
jgi:hypothetical protein